MRKQQQQQQYWGYLLLLGYLLGAAVTAVGATAAGTFTTWGPCPFAAPPEIATAYVVQCGVLRVPLDYYSSSSSSMNHTLPYHVTRLTPASLQPRQIRGQLWMLNGGPGYPGGDLLLTLAKLFNGSSSSSNVLPYAIYLPDHRGTGYSAELTCQDGGQNLDDPACLAYPQQRRRWLAHFTVTHAAEDLHLALASQQQSRQPQFLFGISYGTQLVHRLLQLHPSSGCSGVVLDSVVNPTSVSTATLDARANQVALTFLKLCEEDYYCGTVVWGGRSVRGAFQQLLAEMVLGTQACVNAHWPELSGRPGVARVKHALTRLLHLATEYYHRLTVPAFGFRLQRCDPARDVPALTHYFQTLGLLQPPPPPPSSSIIDSPKSRPPSLVRARQSAVLNALIQISENYYYRGQLLPKDLPAEAVEAWEEAAAFTTGASVAFARRWAQGFPTYGDTSGGSLRRTLARPTCPVLLMNGELDLMTPVAAVWEVYRQRPSWYFQPFPLLGHATSSSGGVGITCPVEILLKFLENPMVNPFLASCVSRMPVKLDFEGSSSQASREALWATAARYFNTTQLFDV